MSVRIDLMPMAGLLLAAFRGPPSAAAVPTYGWRAKRLFTISARLAESEASRHSRPPIPVKKSAKKN